MAVVFVSEEIVNRQDSQVWEKMTDWKLASKWMNGIDSLQANGETKPGTVLTFVARGKERSSTIEECKPNEMIVLKSTQGSVTARYRYELSRIDPNLTKVKLIADCESSGILLKLVFPLLKVAIRKADGSQIANLKKLIESD